MAVPFYELRVGSEATWRRRVEASDLDSFAHLSGDHNPLHIDAEYARRQGFRGRVAHGMLISAYLSRVLGTELPGPGVFWLSQQTRFLLPVYPGDEIQIVVRVAHKSDALRTLVLETVVKNERDETVLHGEAKVMVLEQPSNRTWRDTVALVTGSSRGIGAAIAFALGRQGAKVAVHYHQRRDAAEDVVAAIRAAGGEADCWAADLLTAVGPRNLAQAISARWGPIHVLVNNASPPIHRRPAAEVEVADLEYFWRAYVESPWRLVKEVLPGMRSAFGGRIVQILTSALTGSPPADLAAYLSAKSALWSLSKALAVDLAPHGITVNAVSPSAVLTDQWADLPESHRRAMAQRTPMKVLASESDVANSVVYLASPESRYVTGQNILLAGGEQMS